MFFQVKRTCSETNTIEIILRFLLMKNKQERRVLVLHNKIKSVRDETNNITSCTCRTVPIAFIISNISDDPNET